MDLRQNGDISKVDPHRGVLTVTMFVMLGNMIKHDHFVAPISHHICFFLHSCLFIHYIHIRKQSWDPFLIHSDPLFANSLQYISNILLLLDLKIFIL